MCLYPISPFYAVRVGTRLPQPRRLAISVTRSRQHCMSSLLLFALIHTLNHNLNATLLRISCDLESFNRILELESVSNQTLQINNPTAQQSNSPRPSVGVAVLELQIDLARAKTHERDLDFGPADADYEDFSTEFRRVDGTADGGLDAGALHYHGGLDAGGERDDLFGELFWGVGEVDFVRAHAGAELFCESEAALVDVGDNNGLGACGFHASESHQTDRASAADQHAVAQSDVCTLHACEGHAERLEQRAVFVGHVADLVAPDGRVVDVAAQQAGDGRRAAELDADAAVIFSCQAGLALAADDVGLDGDAVADAVSGDGGVFGDDYAGGLVA
jgi:hypothetical protein